LTVAGLSEFTFDATEIARVRAVFQTEEPWTEPEFFELLEEAEDSGVTGENLGVMSQVLKSLVDRSGSTALLGILPTDHVGSLTFSIKTPDDLSALAETMAMTDVGSVRRLAKEAFADSFSRIEDNAELIDNSVEGLCRAFSALQRTFAQAAADGRGHASFLS
jgi:hypothetical protein